MDYQAVGDSSGKRAPPQRIPATHLNPRLASQEEQHRHPLFVPMSHTIWPCTKPQGSGMGLAITLILGESRATRSYELVRRISTDKRASA